MRRALLLAAPALSLLAACGPGQSASTDTTTTAAASSTAVAVPAAPQPAQTASCPYLDTTFVQDANGQHVGSVKISTDSASHPSCFFYRPDGGLQLTVRVYVGDAQVANALVNQAAPVATSSPADQPSGWSGGYQSTGTGAVYAVAKGGDAVVVITNQAQTIKARRVAVQAISGLGL